MLTTDLCPDIESISAIKPTLHPGVQCAKCKRHLGHEVRIMCVRCDDMLSFCEACNGFGTFANENHPATHELVRLRDSNDLTLEKLMQLRAQADEDIIDHDSFAFQTWRKEKLKDDPVAFELIKKMLRQENDYRLGDYYLAEYKKSNVDNWKTEVTEILQRRVVDEFLEEAKASGIYANQAEGIRFLRAASGNFEHRIEEIKECANYVKYTHFCVRGPLRRGDYVDLSKFPLINPADESQELLSDWLKPGKPLVIISSSYT